MLDAATGDPSNPGVTDDSASSSRPAATTASDDSSAVTYVTNITDGQWHLVVVTTTSYEQTAASQTSQPIVGPVLRQPGYKLYIDGVLTAELTSSTSAGSGGTADSGSTSPGGTSSSTGGADGGDPLYMGGAPAVICGRADGDITRSFQGSISQLMLFGRSLTEADLNLLYYSSFQASFLGMTDTSASSSSIVGSGILPEGDLASAEATYPTTSSSSGSSVDERGAVDGTSDTSAASSSDTVDTMAITAGSSSSGDSSSSSLDDGPLVMAAEGPATDDGSSSSSRQGDDSLAAAAPAASMEWDLPEGSACDLEPMTVRSPRYCEGGQVRLGLKLWQEVVAVFAKGSAGDIRGA